MQGDNDVFCVPNRLYAGSMWMTNAPKPLDINAALTRSPWFQGLPSAAIKKLADGARVKQYAMNSYLYSVGEQTTEVFCVLSGRVRVSITGTLGQEFAITDMESESWLGEPALTGDEPRVLDAQVKETAMILVLPRSVVLAVGEQYPLMYRNLFSQHVTRSRSMYELLGGMLFYPLRARLAGRLLELVAEHGEEVEGGVYLNINLSQNDFARLSFGSRQRINKIFGEWSEQGIVVTQSEHYFIKDIDALVKETDLSEL